MKKQFISILMSFASIITVVSATPYTNVANAAEDTEQPPYQYIGDDAVEFVDREETYYFMDVGPDVIWEFNKVYSLSPEYAKSFDVKELREKAESACVVCRPMHPETEPDYVMTLSLEEMEVNYNPEPDKIYVADGMETFYNLIQPKWWNRELSHTMMEVIVNGEGESVETVPYYDFNYDGVVRVDDVLYLNKIYSSIPSMWVTNLGIGQNHEKMNYRTFLEILETRYASTWDQYPEITIRFGENWRTREVPVDESAYEAIAKANASASTAKFATAYDDLLRGNVNDDGNIDSSDAALVLRQYALVQSAQSGDFTDTQKELADYNNDGSVDSSDAALILKCYANNQSEK